MRILRSLAYMLALAALTLSAPRHSSADDKTAPIPAIPPPPAAPSDTPPDVKTPPADKVKDPSKDKPDNEKDTGKKGDGKPDNFHKAGPKRQKKEVPSKEPAVVLPADLKDPGSMSEKEYLMYKASRGTRPERLEALDVIERTVDAEMVPFLVDRLAKEDDRLLELRIMRALAHSEDVRAIPPLRVIANKDRSRIGVEAVVALYDLGDDNYVSVLINMMRTAEDYPELAALSHRTLKKIYGVNIAQSARAWNTYYHSHRLVPYQKQSWYAAFRPPLPPTVSGTTKVSEEARSKGVLRLPQEDVKVRRSIVTFYDFWKPDD